MVSNISSVVPS